MVRLFCFFAFIFGFLLVQNGFAQKRIVSGKVTSQRDTSGLPGVNIVIKGTSNGTISDMDGKFSLTITDSCVLVFRFIGFITSEIKIDAKQTEIKVALAEDVRSLDEVVVTAYGISRKKSVTSSSTAVGSPMKIRGMKSKSEKTTSTPISTGSNSNIVSGLLTAGEVNDFSKWKLWNDISTANLKTHQSTWKINPKERFSFQLTDKQGFPAIDQAVDLVQNDSVIWSARTDNTGKAEFWANLFENNSDLKATYQFKTQCNGQQYSIKQAQPFATGMNHLRLDVDLKFPDQVDIAFVVDATSSMSDEINYLKVELNDIIEKAKNKHKDLSLNLGSVFYRDAGDEYITKKSELNSDLSQTINFIKSQQSGGGGDFPEAVDSALNVAINHLEWRKEARTRLLFLVLDAPPHANAQAVKNMQVLAKEAAKKGIKIIPVASSGIDKSTEYLLRAIALATNGTYTFLTDDSGIGDKHIKPTTDKWEVEHLNELLIRLINQYVYVPVIQKKKKETVLVDSISANFSEKIISQQENGIVSADSIVKKPEKDLSPKDLVFNLKMYPNPTSGIVNIKISDEISELFLADISGKILEKFTPINQQLLTINIGNYPMGLYFLKYPYKGKWKAGKIILAF